MTDIDPETRRVALVVGGVRGLGLATARRLAAPACSVHITYRSSSGAARELEAEFPGRIHRVDALDTRSLEDAVAAIRERDGRLDALVHTVGDYASSCLEDMSVEEAEALFSSNVTTALRAFEAARALLRSSRGSVVFFGCAGLAGHRARRSSGAYGAAKSALLVLVRSWALEEASHGVRVNMVSPGVIPHADAHAETCDPEVWNRIPAGRPGDVDEVAEAVAFLCSEAAAYTTGADIPVAGGWML